MSSACIVDSLLYFSLEDELRFFCATKAVPMGKLGNLVSQQVML